MALLSCFTIGTLSAVGDDKPGGKPCPSVTGGKTIGPFKGDEPLGRAALPCLVDDFRMALFDEEAPQHGKTLLFSLRLQRDIKPIIPNPIDSTTDRCMNQRQNPTIRARMIHPTAKKAIAAGVAFGEEVDDENDGEAVNVEDEDGREGELLSSQAFECGGHCWVSPFSRGKWKPENGNGSDSEGEKGGEEEDGVGSMRGCATRTSVGAGVGDGTSDRATTGAMAEMERVREKNACCVTAYNYKHTVNSCACE